MAWQKGSFSKIEIPKEELEELKERVKKLEAQLEKEKIPEEKAKIVKKEIGDFIKEMGKTPSFAPPLKLRDEAKEIEKFSRPEQVGALISLVFEKGLKYAVEVAKELNNPAILDEFHDTLVDKYYQVLIEEHVIEPL